MRRLLLLSVGSLLLGACAAPVHIVTPRMDDELSLAQLADRLAQCDVVFLGEEHDHPDVHRTHQRILEELQARRPQLTVSMEMFERDVQTPLLTYLAGDLVEGDFLSQARPWNNYATDYRPVIEFCKAHGLPVLAANAPTALVRKAAREGLGAVAGEHDVARSVSTPKDEYWTAFGKEMGDHGSDPAAAAAMDRMYGAQCLRDDTMAETIADHIQAARGRTDVPFVVHFCGRFHSDYRRGTVARLQARLPALKIAVLSVEEVADLDARRYRADRDVADYVLVVRKLERKEDAANAKHQLPVAKAHPAGDQAAAGGDAGAAKAGVKLDPHAVVHPAAGGDEPTGERPALGVMPDYQFGGPGMRVDTVKDGGPAAAAGIKAGDVVVKLGNEAIEDTAGYAAALAGLHVGQTVEVTVRRDGKDVKLTAKVGSR